MSEGACQPSWGGSGAPDRVQMRAKAVSGLRSAPCTPVTPTAARPGDRNSALLGSQSDDAAEPVVPRREAPGGSPRPPPGWQLPSPSAPAPALQAPSGQGLPSSPWRAQSRLFSPQLLLQPASQCLESRDSGQARGALRNHLLREAGKPLHPIEDMGYSLCWSWAGSSRCHGAGQPAAGGGWAGEGPP